jgi:hypothetical protein
MDTTLTLTADVFDAAAQVTRWTRTNLGPRATVQHAGYRWTVQLPQAGEGVARIVGRYGYGGTEFLDVPATLAQTIPIVEAATAAFRAALDDRSWPVYELQRWNWLDDRWETEGVYTSQRGEGNAYFAVSAERASELGPIRLFKDGTPVFADDPATYYAHEG